MKTKTEKLLKAKQIMFNQMVETYGRDFAVKYVTNVKNLKLINAMAESMVARNQI